MSDQESLTVARALLTEVLAATGPMHYVVRGDIADFLREEQSRNEPRPDFFAWLDEYRTHDVCDHNAVDGDCPDLDADDCGSTRHVYEVPEAALRAMERRT